IRSALEIDAFVTRIDQDANAFTTDAFAPHEPNFLPAYLDATPGFWRRNEDRPVSKLTSNRPLGNPIREQIATERDVVFVNSIRPQKCTDNFRGYIPSNEAAMAPQRWKYLCNERF